MAYLLEPRQHRQLLDAAELLFSAWLQVAPDRDAPLTSRAAFWSFVLEFLAAGDRSARSLARLVDRFLGDVVAHDRVASTSLPASGIPSIETPPISERRTDSGERLVRAATRLAAQGGHAELRAILERDGAAAPARERTETPANLLEPEAAPPLFARYDRVEALRYYLRHGVLPWSLSLRDATLTVADTLDVLVDLPFSLLHALVQNLRPDERLQVWQRVARELPGDRLHDLIAALIARTDRPPAVTWSRLSADAEHAADRSLVYAQSITQLIGDDAARQMSLDTAVPEGAADTSGATAASDIENVESPASAGPWETDRIKSILASRARGAPNSAAHEPSSTSLLIRLVEADAEGARHFLRALMDGGIPPSSLIDEMPSPRAIDTVQTLLTPDAAGRVRLMLRMLAALPAALRPGPEAHVHAVILREVLDHFADPQLGPAFFETVLRPLFDLPVAPGAADRLEPLVPALLDPPLPDRDSGPAVSGAISRDESSRTADSGYGRVRTLLTIAAQVVEAGEFTAAEMQPFTAALTRVNLQAVEGEPARDTVALPAALRGEGPIEPRQPEETAANGPLSADEARALDWLRHADGGPGTAGSPSLPDDAFRDALRRLLDRAPDPVRRVVADRVGDPQVRRRWATVLSESELVRMAFLLEPRQHRQVLDAAELLVSAWLQVATDRDAPLTRRTAFWSFVLEFLATGDRSARSLARLVDRFFADVGAHERSDSTSLPASAIPAIDTPAITDKRAETGERLVRAATRLAAQAGHAALLAILERDRAALLGRGRGDTPAPPAPSAIDVRRPSPPHFDDSPARAGRPRSRTAFSMTDEEEEIGGEPIYIANAGLILTHPFLPQLFQSLDMLERAEDGRRRLIADQVSRAVHLLQSLVDGRTSAPEPLLCLNKLLCGVPLSTPVERSIEATPRDLEICRTLLNSLIANWPIISNTSVQGLQETFLQREGRLQRASDGWRLLVQRKTVDVLLDHIPWSISTITHGWMLEPIFVTW